MVPVVVEVVTVVVVDWLDGRVKYVVVKVPAGMQRPVCYLMKHAPSSI